VATHVDPDRLLIGLGRAIRELREERGVSQERLALDSGIHRNYWGGIERGERQPSFVVVVRISAALGVSVSDLVAEAERLTARR
jgi:transcriptional regulator with XRE-family HTH domain